MAVGRLDRSGWKIQKDKIDCHALRPGYLPENWSRIKEALQLSFDYPEWVDKYVNEYNLNINK
jgi:hypothetical protein